MKIQTVRINPKIAAAIGASLLLFVIISVLLAPRYVESRIKQKIASIAERTGYVIGYDSIEVSGFIHIRLKGVTAVTDLGESFASIGGLDVTINPIRYLFGADAIGRLQIDSADIWVWKGMMRDKDQPDTEDSAAKDEEQVSGFREMIKKALQLVPEQVSIADLTVRYGTGRNKSVFILRSAQKDGADIRSLISMAVGRDSSSLSVSGTYDGESWDMLFRSTGKKSVHIPYACKFSQSYVGFDSIRVAGEFSSASSLRAVHRFWVYNSAVSHFRLSRDRVRVPYFAGRIDAGFSSKSIEIYDSSFVQLNDWTMDIKMAFEYRSPKHLLLDISTRPCSAQDAVESLPPGMLTCLRGIKLKGQIAFEVHADIDYAHLDDLSFDVAVHADGLKIVRYGECNLGMMSNDFNYSVYENGSFVRQIAISASNPNFVPYDQISPFLRESVQIAEDGQFFAHRGFIAESFRHALAQNLKAGRFVRGGSTISQQLVKNVFLSRSKTIFRKLEEAAIVWLIEEKRLTSKQRMFEVYLNVIEWAPNVYGIAEAADFYFGKPASQLSLAESIYLTSLVPKPKKFIYSFDKEGHLRSHYDRYYRSVAQNLVAAGRIQPADTVGLAPISALTGRAAQYIAVTDTVSAEDTLMQLEILPLDSLATPPTE